jgi:multisubunit Na+/H+ antiporter MnhB subunit
VNPDTSPADRVLRIGGVITAIGIVCTLIAMLPLVIPSLELPGAMWFLAMLTGVGLIVVFVGLAMGARARRSR